MKCPAQDELIELAFALANKEELAPASKRAATHAAQCEGCKRRLEVYLRDIRDIKSALTDPAVSEPTPSCLDGNMMACYVDGTLDEDARLRAERHMAECDLCLQRLLELDGLVAGYKKASFRLIEYVIGVARRGLRILSYPASGFDLEKAEPVLMLEPDKSGEPRKGCAWTQEIGGLCLHFSIVQVDAEHVDLSLSVGKESVPEEGTRVTLVRRGHILHSETLSEKGAVSVKGLELAAYSGEVTTPSGDVIPFSIDFQALS